MALTAANVLTRVTDILQDASYTRWTSAELVRWLNDARRDLLIRRPDLYAFTTVMSLTGGAKQSIPTDGDRFLDAIRNYALDGVTPGAAVRIIEREVLDAARPSWATETPAAAVKNFMFDERSPKRFDVYPPVLANTNLEVVYSKPPTEILPADTNIPLTEEGPYAVAIIDYVCFRAYSKDAEYGGNASRAAAHYELYKTTIGEGDMRDVPSSPNSARVDAIPPRGG